MSSVQEPHLHVEVGHILFLDIVGYSKLLADEQKELIQELNQIVRKTEQFRAAEAARKLTRLPTGDGMVLVFTNNPEAPVECALEIAKAFQSHPKLKLRMGIHSGPVNPVSDVNDQSNLAGAGINVAQRVMYCGDAGHILLSKHFAEDLEHYAHWRSCLHDVGIVKAKHGTRISIVNFYTNELGNSHLPAKLRRAKAAFRLKSAVVAALLLIMALGIAFWMIRRSQEKLMNVTPPEKSIAVLPFENRSEDKANAYFADGIQDEILTRLSNIADLRVISRTSTRQYQSKPANLREIAKQLGVANILEGSVQKVADQVRVNVQLINAQSDTHLWANTYDRKLTDIFAVESEIAKGIAESLRAKLTGREEQALAVKPTNNTEAYDVYLRGLAYALRPGYHERDILAAVQLFRQAVKLDSNFAVAWAWLSRVSARGYFNSAGSDVAALRETAKDAVAKASQLQPDFRETLLAQGYFHYYCEQNYDAAIASFEKARQLAPKTSDALEALALVLRRVGKWQQTLECFRQATEIDPRNTSILVSYGETYAELREYPFALKVYDQLLEISPDNTEALVSKAAIYQAVANLSEAARLLSRIRSDPSSENFFVQIWQRIYERAFVEAIAMIKDAIATPDLPLGIKATYGWTLADLKEWSGDTLGARIEWQQVKDEVESLRRQTKGERFVFPTLAAAYAALGDKHRALAIVDQVPVNALNVGGLAYLRARIAVYAGDKYAAIEYLTISAHNPVPGGPGFSATYGDLKLNPVWDTLRGDPRFEKIVKEAKKPLALK